MNNNLINVINLVKNFDEQSVIKNISFNVKKNSIVGILGKNGAGKTTLLRLMAGIMEPTKGSVLFKGERVSTMRNKLGVVPESTGLYSRLTAWENIRYH